MKRITNVGGEFLSFENFDKAERKARRNKSKSKGVKYFDKKYHSPELRAAALSDLIEKVKSGEFKSTPPVTFEKVTQGGKLRNISVVPYFPDIVYAHAVLNVVEKRFESNLIYDVYSYNRGIHLLCRRLQAVLSNWGDNNIYVLKMDVRKFYESIDCEILKAKIESLVRDKIVLRSIYDIIDTHNGLTIGMLLSQLFSSVYLSGLDHFIKEQLKIKHYYRYADDVVVLGDSKEELHEVLYRFKNRLFYEYKLELKYWQIFDLELRPLDYVGYVFHKTHTTVRKKTKRNFAKKRHNRKSVASYLGILKWCNGRNLINKILEENNNAKKRTDK